MIVYILLILLLLYIFFSNSKEGFENKTKKTFIDDNIYDKFYSKLYDNIWDMIPFYKVQIEIMKPYFFTTNNFLCFDCKTGHMPQLLSNNMKVVGLDKSKYMIELSKEKYPTIPFIQGDCNPSIFKSNLFTHIYCPLFSINTKDIDLFFQCVDKWLISKGILFIITYNNINISKFIISNSSIDYSIELTNTIREKISFNNIKRTNIQYLNDVNFNDSNFNYYKLLNQIEIPNYSCYLNIYQKT
jgi:SAM-dependent methyltransferase